MWAVQNKRACALHHGHGRWLSLSLILYCKTSECIYKSVIYQCILFDESHTTEREWMNREWDAFPSCLFPCPCCTFLPLERVLYEQVNGWHASWETGRHCIPLTASGIRYIVTGAYASPWEQEWERWHWSHSLLPLQAQDSLLFPWQMACMASQYNREREIPFHMAHENGWVGCGERQGWRLHSTDD